MRVVSFIAGLLMALPVQAADVALILGDIGQVETMRAETTVTATDFAIPLREAGFEIIQPRNRSSGNMRLAARRLETMLEASEVDRLVIVAMGPVAHSAREAWALSNGATGASSLNVGVTGVPIGALSDMAAVARGPAVILIAPGRRFDALGNGLQPGLGDLKLRDGVTYVIGPPGPLVSVLADGLLNPEMSYDAVSQKGPEGVRFLGYLPTGTGFVK